MEVERKKKRQQEEEEMETRKKVRRDLEEDCRRIHNSK